MVLKIKILILIQNFLIKKIATPVHKYIFCRPMPNIHE